MSDNVEESTEIIITDRVSFDLETLARAELCLSKYNNYMQTPGYGMLNSSNFSFISTNRNYKKSSSRRSMDNYAGYYGYEEYYFDPASTYSSEASGILHRTILGLVQFDEDVNKRFQAPEFNGRYAPPEKELVKPVEFAVDNFMDGFATDSINGITAYINTKRLKYGYAPLPYMYRLGAGDTLGLDRHVEEALATSAYATGAVCMNAALKSIDSVAPGLGTGLAKINSAAQGTGVMISYSMADDGIVSRGEHAASVIFGTGIGLALDAGADKLTRALPAPDVVGNYLGGYLGAGIEEFSGSGNAFLIS